MDTFWLTQGDRQTPKVKIGIPGFAIWLSFHVTVAGLSLRACIAAFLAWLIPLVRRWEQNEGVRMRLQMGAGERVAADILGVDVNTMYRTGRNGFTRLPILSHQCQLFNFLTSEHSVYLFHHMMAEYKA